MSDFEKYLKDSSRSFKMDPDPGSFDKIMNALDEKKKKKRGAYWWFLVPGIALGVTLLLVYIYPGQDTNKLVNDQPLTHTSTPGQPEKNTGAGNNNYTTATEQSSGTQNAVPGNATNNKTVTKTNTYTSTEKGSAGPGKTSDTKQINNHTPVSTGNHTPRTNTVEDRNKHANTTRGQGSVQGIGTGDPAGETHTVFTTPGPDLHTEDQASANHTDGSDNDPVTDIIRGNVQDSTERTDRTNGLPFISSGIGKIPLKAITKTPFAPVPLLRLREPFSRWSIGAYMEAGAAKSNYFASHQDTNAYPYAKARQQTDIFMFSYSAGIKFRYSPLRWLSVESGIGYTRYESSQIVGEPGLGISGTSPGNTNMDMLEPDSVYTMSSPAFGETQRISSVYGYLSIPLNIYFQKRWNWIGVEAGAGVVFDFAVHTKSYMPVDSTNLTVLSKDVNQARLNVFGATAQGHVNAVFHAGRFSFYIGPTFRYRINSMFRDNYPMQQHIYFIGGETGVRYNF